MIKAKHARRLMIFSVADYNEVDALEHTIRDRCKLGLGFIITKDELRFEVRQILKLRGFKVTSKATSINPATGHLFYETTVRWL